MMPTDEFSIADHIELTHKAGCDLNDPTLVNVLCENVMYSKTWIESHIGSGFNLKNNAQGYWFTGGGAGFFAALKQCISEQPNIELIESCNIIKLLTDAECQGALAMLSDETFIIQSTSTILATGGYAGIYSRHDNPGKPVGAGITLALNAGAVVRDMEFVQFYPLGLAEPNLPTFMAFRPFPSEAKVINSHGESITEKYLGTDDLNEAIGTHRDKFSQTIKAEQQHGPVKLDLTNVNWDHLDHWFSLQFLTRYDFPWQTDPATISPIAHHTMGGIAVNKYGQTSIKNLYAVGEVASGLHGANRLGSNSLTECLVFGKIAGHHAAKQISSVGDSINASGNLTSAKNQDLENLEKLQQACWQNLGLSRDASSLKTMQSILDIFGSKENFTLKAQQIAQLVTLFAQQRKESRGAHQRTDFPDQDDQQQQSLFTIKQGSKIVFIDNPF